MSDADENTHFVVHNKHLLNECIGYVTSCLYWMCHFTYVFDVSLHVYIGCVTSCIYWMTIFKWNRSVTSCLYWMCLDVSLQVHVFIRQCDVSLSIYLTMWCVTCVFWMYDFMSVLDVSLQVCFGISLYECFGWVTSCVYWMYHFMSVLDLTSCVYWMFNFMSVLDVSLHVCFGCITSWVFWMSLHVCICDLFGVYRTHYKKVKAL